LRNEPSSGAAKSGAIDVQNANGLAQALLADVRQRIAALLTAE
jgi:hypothetical protein